MSKFINFFKKRLSLAGVTSSFHKVIAQLEALKLQHKLDIEAKAIKAAAINAEIEAHKLEHEAASAIHANISALLSKK